VQAAKYIGGNGSAEPHVGESLRDSQFSASQRDAATWFHRMNCDDVLSLSLILQAASLHYA